MASVNKVILVGNLGADPEMRSTAGGDAVCTLRLATSEQWKDKASGETRESTEWHRVVLFRRLAEVAGQYLKKGSPVFIEGRIRTRKWQDKDGQDRYTTEVEASEMKMLGGAPTGAPGTDQRDRRGGDDAGEPRPRPSSRDATGNVLDDDDDIPF